MLLQVTWQDLRCACAIIRDMIGTKVGLCCYKDLDGHLRWTCVITSDMRGIEVGLCCHK